MAKGVALFLAIALIAAVASTLWFMRTLDSTLSPDSDELASINGQLVEKSLDEPFYILVLGSDSREGSGVDSDSLAYAEGQERSDVILLMRVDAGKKLVTMVSVPRDTMYTMANGDVVKLNEVYNYEGASGSIKAVSEITGEGISHYVEVHLSEMESIVDSLGGIEVYVDRELGVNDSLSGTRIELEPGLQTLNGQQAQAFLRARHAYSDEDNQDASRQSNVRTFVEAIIKKTLEKPVAELPGTVLELAQYVTTDLNSVDLISLALKFSDGDITMYSCSGPSDGEEMEQYGGLWMCYPNPEGWAELMRQVDAGLKPGDIDYAATAITE